MNLDATSLIKEASRLPFFDVFYMAHTGDELHRMNPASHLNLHTCISELSGVKSSLLTHIFIICLLPKSSKVQ